jgi:hypothetical protein
MATARICVPPGDRRVVAGVRRAGVGAAVIARVIGWLVWAFVYVYFVKYKRRPQHTIRLEGERYITRWFLQTDPAPGSTLAEGWHLHRIHTGDGDRRLHNHPTETAHAYVLRGGYTEERRPEWRDASEPPDLCEYRPGDRVYLPPYEYHRIRTVHPNTWTLFHAGRKHGRGWGFR